MAQVSSQNVASETPMAPLERGIGTEFLYTDIVQLCCDGKNEYDGPISDLVEHRLEGCGKVDLVQFSVKYQAGAGGARIYLGTSAVGSSATAKALAMNRNGHAHISNNFNAGAEHIVDLVPMSNVSRQIQPASTNLPMLRFTYEKTSTMSLNLTLYLKVEGVRVYNDTIAMSSEPDGEEE